MSTAQTKNDTKSSKLQKPFETQRSGMSEHHCYGHITLVFKEKFKVVAVPVTRDREG